MPKFNLKLRGLGLDPRIENELVHIITQIQNHYDNEIANLKTQLVNSTGRIKNIESSSLFAGALAVPLIENVGDDIATVSPETTLIESDIPDLPASKITTGTLDAARIPNLNANKITSGNLASARQDIDTIYSNLTKVLGAPAIDGHIVVSREDGTTIKVLTTT